MTPEEKQARQEEVEDAKAREAAAYKLIVRHTGPCELCGNSHFPPYNNPKGMSS
jgi:hypothetical protein